MRIIKSLILVILLFNLNACGVMFGEKGLYGPINSVEDAVQAAVVIPLSIITLPLWLPIAGLESLNKADEKKQLAEQKKQKLKELQNACKQWNALTNKKYADGRTFEEELHHFYKVNKAGKHYHFTILALQGLDISELKFNKGDLLYIVPTDPLKPWVVQVVHNIPDVGAIVLYTAQYGKEFKFLIKGYHNADGYNEFRFLPLVKEGVYSYNTTFGPKTVYSFTLMRSNNKAFMKDLEARVKLYYNYYDYGIIKGDYCDVSKVNIDDYFK